MGQKLKLKTWEKTKQTNKQKPAGAIRYLTRELKIINYSRQSCMRIQ